MPPPPAPAPPAPAPAPAPPPRKRKLTVPADALDAPAAAAAAAADDDDEPAATQASQAQAVADAGHRCPICQEVFCEPLRLPRCSHSMCKHCAVAFLRSDASKNGCPECRSSLDGIDVDAVDAAKWADVQARFPAEVARQQRRLEAADQGDQKSRAEIAKQYRRFALMNQLRAEMDSYRRELLPVCRDYFARLPLELARVDGVARCMCRGRRYVCLVAVSKSEKNFGRKFYKCPRGSNGCKYFKWYE